MKLRDLIEHFSTRIDLPVKPMEVARILMEQGVEEEISFVAVEINDSILRGFIVQTSEQRSLYDSSGNGLKSTIYYGKGQPFEWQRLVICKELVHLLDPSWAQTRSSEEVEGLVRRIVLPPEFQPEGEHDGDGARALFDRIGELLAVSILFPITARGLLLPKYENRILTDDDIASIVVLPQRYVKIVMSEF